MSNNNNNNNTFPPQDRIALTLQNVNSILGDCLTPSNSTETPQHYACGDKSTGWNNTQFKFYPSKLMEHRNQVLYMMGQLQAVHTLASSKELKPNMNRMMEFFEGKLRTDNVNWTISSEETTLPSKKLQPLIFSRLLCFYTLAHACGIIEQFHAYVDKSTEKPRLQILCPILNKGVLTPTDVPLDIHISNEGVEPADD